MDKHVFYCCKCNKDFESKSESPDICPYCKCYTWDVPESFRRQTVVFAMKKSS